MGESAGHTAPASTSAGERRPALRSSSPKIGVEIAMSTTDRLTSTPVTVVLHTGGMYLASEKAVVERGLGSRPDVLAVEANPVAQTSNVTYDASRTTVGDLRRCVEECGYQCAGQSVPTHLCEPMAEPSPAAAPA